MGAKVLEQDEGISQNVGRLHCCVRKTIVELRWLLAPLEAGRMITHKKSAETGGVMRDTTADDIAARKSEIAAIETVVAQRRHKAE